MYIENPEYADATRSCILATINGKSSAVPCDPENADYAEIMRLVDAGELTVAEPE